jgi:hypothetical protein
MRCLRPFLIVFCIAFVVPLALPLLAQKNKPEPLTEAQVDQIAEAGIDPNQRVILYTKFVTEHADTIKSLTGRSKSPARAKRLDDELQSLTALMDEFGANLDVYSDRHADIRRGMKPLPDETQKWLGILHGLIGEPSFDEARKEAIESGEDLADQAKRLLTEQTEYFNLHKDEQNQDRAEPK